MLRMRQGMVDCGNCILGISVYLEWRVCTDAQNEAGYDRTGGIGWNQLLMWINPPSQKLRLVFRKMTSIRFA